MPKKIAPDQGYAQLRFTCPRGHDVGAALLQERDDMRLLIRQGGPGTWTSHRRADMPEHFTFKCTQCYRAGEYRVSAGKVESALLAIVDDPTRGTATMAVGG